MQDNIDNITLALAGMLQAIALINELTQTGKTQDDAFQASLQSVLQTESTNTLAVFGGIQGVKLGLEKIIHTLQTTHSVDRIQHRYFLSLIVLQKKLMRSPKLLNTISTRLKQINKQVNYFSLTHPTVISNLADTYLTTLGTFKFRMMILGNQRILNVRENTDKLRALLLAGVRSAVLWRQMGGSRLHLLFFRTKIKASAERLLAQIEHHTLASKDTL